MRALTQAEDTGTVMLERNPKVLVSGINGGGGLLRAPDGLPILAIDECGNVGINGRLFQR